ncbi:MAG: DUF262 domain-containing protein [Lachnospiraceae bacterium]|nr:DUF262 domain-containing protein [Lachnospiraceae bacterium]
MIGSAKPLVKFLDGSSTRFIIPVYQRNYDWKIVNCTQLFDDLIKVVKTPNRDSHFFGSVVSVANIQGASSEMLIIDGQQRITTISLLFLALVNLLKDGRVESEKTYLADQIQNTYLIDPYEPEEKKVKLKPIKDDQDAFLKLFGDKEEYNMTSNVTQNYMYFYNRIQKGELTPEEIFNAICSLVIIDISLDPTKDDAQLIFESLNSTGLDLSEGDKIRNFILMGLDSDKQERYYNKYWNKIEKDTDYQVSDYVRHYLTISLGRTPAIKEVYSCFKSYVEKNKFETEELLLNMVKYAKYYKEIKNSSTNVYKANIVLSRLNVLDMSVSIPYLMGLWEYRENVGMIDTEFVEVLTVIETYIFRRMICGVPTNALNKIFAMLHKDCIRYKKDNDQYVEVLKYLLNSKVVSGRMPKDSEFLRSIEEKNIYSMQAKNKMYLFDRLENEDSVEHTNVIQMMQDGVYTIEHIMPQTLSNAWKKDLGTNYLEIHDKWINRLANLTLTGYNSQYSNRSFLEKRDTEKGFKDSHLHINAEIAKCEKWTEDEIIQRNNMLKGKFLVLWSYPTSSYEPEKVLNEMHTLDEDYDFKGKYFVSYSFLDTPYSANSWSDMYQQVVKFLFELDATIIYKLVTDNTGLGIHFSDKEEKGFVEIEDKVFLYVATSTMSKISALKKLFSMYELDGSELVLEIQSEETNEEND